MKIKIILLNTLVLVKLNALNILSESPFLATVPSITLSETMGPLNTSYNHNPSSAIDLNPLRALPPIFERFSPVYSLSMLPQADNRTPEVLGEFKFSILGHCFGF